MSRLLAAALCVILLLTAVPAFAGELAQGDPAADDSAVESAPVNVDAPAVAEPVLRPCANPEGLPVLTAAGLTPAVATPSFLLDREVESVDLLVDLSATQTDEAAVDVLLAWGRASNDYDLEIVGPGGSDISELVQPDAPAQENATLDQVEHCDVVTINVIDFLAPLVADALELSVTLVDPRAHAAVDAEDEADAAVADPDVAPSASVGETLR